MTVQPLRGGRIVAGRDLLISAEDATGCTVVFDRNSGDYWIISRAARELLMQLDAGEFTADSKHASVTDELVRANIVTHT